MHNTEYEKYPTSGEENVEVDVHWPIQDAYKGFDALPIVLMRRGAPVSSCVCATFPKVIDVCPARLSVGGRG